MLQHDIASVDDAIHAVTSLIRFSNGADLGDDFSPCELPMCTNHVVWDHRCLACIMAGAGRDKLGVRCQFRRTGTCQCSGYTPFHPSEFSFDDVFCLDHRPSRSVCLLAVLVNWRDDMLSRDCYRKTYPSPVIENPRCPADEELFSVFIIETVGKAHLFAPNLTFQWPTDTDTGADEIVQKTNAEASPLFQAVWVRAIEFTTELFDRLLFVGHCCLTGECDPFNVPECGSIVVPGEIDANPGWVRFAMKSTIRRTLDAPVMIEDEVGLRAELPPYAGGVGDTVTIDANVDREAANYRYLPETDDRFLRTFEHDDRS